MVKILPILIGIFGSYIVGLVVGLIDPNALGLSWVNLSAMKGAQIVAVPPFTEYSPLRFLFGQQTFDPSIAWPSIVTFCGSTPAGMPGGCLSATSSGTARYSKSQKKPLFFIREMSIQPVVYTGRL